MRISKTLVVKLSLAAAAAGMVVLGLMRGVYWVRTAAGEANDQGKLKQLGFAVLNYEGAYRALPPVAITDKDGKPLLSWRVAILPFIEGEPLYKRFRLDEPWDSDHNFELLGEMPHIYAPANQYAKCPPFHTFHRVFTGNGTPFEEGQTVDFKTGFSNSLDDVFLIVEAGKPVPWTKPDELLVQDGKPLPPLGGAWPKRFQAVMANGALWSTEKPFDEAVIRPMVYRIKPK